MRARFVVLGIAMLMALTVGARPASASTGGTPDGNTHPNVGLILFYQPDGRFRCSATLISPTVLVTAAHCTDADLGKVLVDFRSVVAETPPSGYPAAADPSAGYTAAEITAAGFRSGTAYTHPDYSHFTDLDNWNDVGVIVLDQPVSGIAPAQLAGLGTLDTIGQNNLRKTLFTAVGYGTEVRKPDSGPQKPTPQDYPLIRRYVDMPGQKLTSQILQTNGNEHDVFGTGGTCFGDSGGPVFYLGKIVAVTSYGYTDNCRYLGGYQRVDIAVTQDWVRSYL
jgi:hypothetical protein